MTAIFDEITAHLVDALTTRHADLIWDRNEKSPQARIDRDVRLAEQYLSGGPEVRLIRLWRNSHALVIPRGYARHARFPQISAASPLPILLRHSGGSAVVHGPHVINLSLIEGQNSAKPFDLDDNYTNLFCILEPAFASMGIRISSGTVTGSYCDGRHNICVGARKLAGTAAFVKQRARRRAVVTHASIVIENRADDMRAIATLQRALGRNCEIRPDMHTDLRHELSSARFSYIPRCRIAC